MNGLCEDGYIEIHGGEIYRGAIITRTNSNCADQAIGTGWYGLHAKVEGLNFVVDSSSAIYRGTISEDGQKISIKAHYKRDNEDSTQTYTRVGSPRWSIMNRK